ncbi:MAG: VOC family protein [Candidatus Brockarchaeota archaeon]|nr:VOC family protein [Candidatus Brockarchaeota archaeon]
MRLEYVGIRVKDMDESIRFYTELLGMKLLDRAKIPTTKGETAALQSPGSKLVLELNYYEEGSPFATPYEAGDGLDHLGFKVDDVKAEFENLRRKGATVALEPFEETNDKEATGFLAFVQDPNGIWIELFQ